MDELRPLSPETEPEPPEPCSEAEPVLSAGAAGVQTVPESTSESATRATGLAEHAQFGLLALVIALYIITFVVQAFRIPSGSMENTLLVGDYLLVDKTRFGPDGGLGWLMPYRPVRRGDIVVFRYPVDPSQHFVKRVVGLPGDRIRLWHARVYVNGQPLNEPYVVYKEHTPDEFRDNFPAGRWNNENVEPKWAQAARSHISGDELRVPAGQYFVMGDNRDQSLDSRYWGFVPRANISGRPIFLYLSVASDDEEEEEASETGAPDGKLFTLRARVAHLLGELRWRRILRLAP